MILKNPIDAVIKKIPAATVETIKNGLNDRQQLVAVKRDGQVVDENERILGIRRWNKSQLTHYLVTNNEDSGVIKIACVISEPMSTKRVNIEVSCSLVCMPGNEERVVEKLQVGSSPQDRLSVLIKEWTLSYERGLRKRNKESSLITDFFSLKEDLTDHLKSKINEELSLDSTIRLKLTDEGVDEKITLKSKPFTIKFSDFEEPISVHFTTEAEFAEIDRIKAFTNKVSSQKLEKAIKDTIVKAAKKVKISDWNKHLDEENFDHLLFEINKSIAEYGRELKKLSVVPEDKFKSLIGNKTYQGGRFDHELRDRSAGDKLKLEVIYEYKPAPGRQVDAIKGLFRAGSKSRDNFQQLVADRIQRFYESKRETEKEVISAYYDWEDTLKSEIESRLLSELGLKSEITLRIAGDADLSLKKIESDHFFARVKDVDEQVKFTFTGEFGVNPKNRIKALAKPWREDKISAAVIDAIKEKMGKETTMMNLYGKPSEVNNTFIPLVEDIIEEYGRKVNFFTLNRLSEISAVEQESYEIPVTCRIKDLPEEIPVTNRLILKLSDVGKFRSQGITDLKEWITTTLENVVKSQLFERTYVEILTKIGDIEEDIKVEINEKVNQIGYSINQHLVAPDLKHLRLKTEGFTIDETIDIPTNDQRVIAKMQLIIRGEVSDLSKLSRFLNTNTNADIEEIILRSAKDIVNRKIQVTSPEDYYMSFEKPDVGGYSLKEEIVNAIYARLLLDEPDKNFGLSESLDVTLKVLETDFIKRFEEIYSRQYHVDLELISFGEIDRGEFVNFHVPFSIVKVYEGGWHNFQIKSTKLSLEEQVEDIKKTIKNILSRYLGFLDHDELQVIDVNTYIDIFKSIIEPAVKEIAETCGLTVRLNQFQRVLSEDEREDLKQISKLNKKRRKSDRSMAETLFSGREEQLKLLIKQRDKLLETVSVDDEDLTDLNEKIALLAPALPEAKVAHGKPKRKREKRKSSLSDFLPPGNNTDNDQLKEGTDTNTPPVNTDKNDEDRKDNDDHSDRVDFVIEE